MKIIYSKKAADKSEYGKYFMIALGDATVRYANIRGSFNLPFVGNEDGSIFYTTSKFMAEAKRIGSESHCCYQFLMKRFANSTLIVCE